MVQPRRLQINRKCGYAWQGVDWTKKKHGVRSPARYGETGGPTDNHLSGEQMAKKKQIEIGVRHETIAEDSLRVCRLKYDVINLSSNRGHKTNGTTVGEHEWRP